MLRQTLATIAILATAGTFGCSWTTNFVILNTTSSVLRIQYELRRLDPSQPYCRCPAGFDYEEPAFVGIDSLKKRMALPNRWHPLPAAAFQFDSSTRRFEVALPPRSALRITTVGTYTGDSEFVKDYFNVVAVNIEGESGGKALSGLALLHAFKKVSDQLYTLGYP